MKTLEYMDLKSTREVLNTSGAGPPNLEKTVYSKDEALNFTWLLIACDMITRGLTDSYKTAENTLRIIRRMPQFTNLETSVKNNNWTAERTTRGWKLSPCW